MRQMTRWSWVWLAWMGAVLGSFAALEHRALTRRTMPTLSRCLAWCFGCHPTARRRPVAVSAFVAAWLWLTVHVVRYRDPD